MVRNAPPYYKGITTHIKHLDKFPSVFGKGALGGILCLLLKSGGK